MDNNSQKTLESLIHRELSKLPERPAPETLIPRVFEQIRARERRRWWQKPWSQWPFAVQLASLPMMLASAGGAIFGLSLIWNGLLARQDLGAATGAVSFLSATWEVVSALGNAAVILGRAASHEWLMLALFVPLTMYLACVGIGTLCYRVAFHHR